MLRSWRSLVAWAALVAAGCTGSGTGLAVSGGSGASDQAGGGSGSPGGGARDSGAAEAAEPEIPPLPDSDSVPGRAPLRRLSILEYNNTIRDLVGGVPAAGPERLGFDRSAWWPSGFVRGASVTTGDDARGLMLSGEAIAAGVMQRLPMLLPCAGTLASAADEEACAGEFIVRFGRRAFRRPLTDLERERLRALYRTLRGPDAGDSFAEAIGDLATAMVQSPEFLYRWELGPSSPVREGSLARFNHYERASRLSYLFWASMPDEDLFEAAQNGRLYSTTELVKQARRLLGDRRAGDGLQNFHQQWLEVDELEEYPKDASFKDYSPALARSMLAESRAFVASVFLGATADGKLSTLLQGTTAFVDAPLAKLYGVTPPAGMEPVNLPANQRAGIFTRAAFLATKADPSDSNPVDRGTTILRRLLCIDLVEPTDLLIPAIPDPLPGQTTRERFEVHGMQPCAISCHQMIVDPLGYAFENYDAIGAWRTTDNGKPVNSRASAPIGGQQREFKDAIELMDILARSDEVRACMTTQWVRFMLGRQDLSTERPSIEALTRLFRKSGDDLRELIVALVRTRTFTHRALSPGEAP